VSDPSTRRNGDTLSRHWLGKTLAGVVCGFVLGVAAGGLLACLAPGGFYAPSKPQIAMWLVPPVWVAVMASAFAFRSGARAWLWLGGASAIALVCLVMARHLVSSS
jgi:hypothetical protein